METKWKLLPFVWFSLHCTQHCLMSRNTLATPAASNQPLGLVSASVPVEPAADFILAPAQHFHHCNKSRMGLHVRIVLKTLQRKETKLRDSALTPETNIHISSRSKQGRGEIPPLLTLARSKVYFFTKFSSSGIRVSMPNNTCSTNRDMAKTRLQQTLREGKRHFKHYNYELRARTEMQ